MHFGSDLSKLPEDRGGNRRGIPRRAGLSWPRARAVDRTAREPFSATSARPHASEAWPRIAAVLAMLFFLLDIAARRGWKFNLGRWTT
ncbi:MAG: hypothetical protein MZW92_53215 [Comamonadaceae bacterium]|nr:hypothetical protein [Comamonadaceae bacterium]